MRGGSSRARFLLGGFIRGMLLIDIFGYSRLGGVYSHSHGHYARLGARYSRLEKLYSHSGDLFSFGRILLSDSVTLFSIKMVERHGQCRLGRSFPVTLGWLEFILAHMVFTLGWELDILR